MVSEARSPAERAAQEASEQMFACLDRGEDFLLEAGAGAGKTYSLILALKYLIDKQSVALRRQHQRIACITYTNVATDEIIARTDGHPVIWASTIHAFCWSLIRNFQPHLREILPQLPKWPERLAEVRDLALRKIVYELGHPRAKQNEDYISLGHDDVILLTVALLDRPKFRNIVSAHYPILLIDEYQDTNEKFADALKTHFIDPEKRPLVGFFGDHWQKIYGDGCGKIEHRGLAVINKGANFRSAPVIVDILNRMRPELRQEVAYPKAEGSVTVFHTNDWPGTRQTGQHWGGDLPPDVSHQYLELVKRQLTAEGWSFEPDQTKILMLTHRVLATELGYAGLTNIFPYSDAFLKKEDPFIAFLLDTVEPVCEAFKNKQYGAMFSALGGRTPAILLHADKLGWSSDIEPLLVLREKGTVGEVIDHLRKTGRPHLTEGLEKKIMALEGPGDKTGEELSSDLELLIRLRGVPYREITALGQFIEEHTPFSTKHGVKGAEFENVLIILGRGWNQYDFNKMLELVGTRIPVDKLAFFERNRNLFYVTCSRAKVRLALLFTQRLSASALSTISTWFGSESINSITLS